MYTTYFGLTEKPFKLKPDGRGLFNSASGQKCYAELVRGLLEQQASIVLGGESGCGKTSLMEKCSTQLADVMRFVRVTNAHLGADDILDVLGQELGIGSRDRNLKRRRRRLRASLAAEQQRGHGVVLVVDDAHSLNDETLTELLQFAAEPLAGQRVLQLVLVGLPELAARCQAITPTLLSFSLEGLLATEIEPFIQHQLKVAGYRGEALFTTDAIRAVANYAGGTPRRINALCDAALFAASLDERRTVTSQLVAEAVEHSFLKDSSPGVPLVIPPPALVPAPAVEQPPAQADSTDEHRMDLARLAADMEQTLERALAVASSSAGIVGSLTKPLTGSLLKKRAPSPAPAAVTPLAPPPPASPQIREEPPAPETSQTRQIPQASVVEPAAALPGAYTVPPRSLFQRPWFMTGAAAMLVLAMVVGGWQWRQQAGAAAMATADRVEIKPQPAANMPGKSTDVVIAAREQPPESRLQLPQPLDAPPPTAARVNSGGLPPVDPDNPFSARPLQSSHQFLDLRGVERDAP